MRFYQVTGRRSTIIGSILTANNGDSKSANNSGEQSVLQEQGDHSAFCTRAKGSRDSKGERDHYTHAGRRSRAHVNNGNRQRLISKEQGYCLYTSARTKRNRGSHPWRPASKRTCAAVFQEEKRGSKENNGPIFWGWRKGTAAIHRRDPSPINSCTTCHKDT